MSRLHPQLKLGSLLREIKAIDSSSKERLVEILSQSRELYNAWVKYQVLQNRRTDILAEAVLGYEVIPQLHLRMIIHQWQHPQNQILGFRGSGKTTIGTVVKIIHLILDDPNIRILLGSKVLTNAQDILKEIKSHFESNEIFKEIFGNYVGDKQWDERSIEVRPREIHTKEPSIMTVGVDGAVASKHYDVVFPDDLVEEANSRTQHMRDRLKRWFYTVLMPVLEPPDPRFPHRGELNISGTRYHPEDLYNHLSKNEMKDTTLVLPAINAAGQSTWPSKFPLKFLERKKKNSIIAFNAQYQCDCEAMEGEIFRFDDLHTHPDSEFPSLSKMAVYQGVDLAISAKEKADCFAQVVVGINKDADGKDHIWVLDFEEAQLRFNQQTDHILKFYNDFDVVKCGVESNAYQLGQLHNLKKEDPNFRGIPLYTTKDKVTRAWKLAALCEAGQIHFRRKHHKLIEHLLRFPNHRKKDLFDALDFAVQIGIRRQKKKRSRLGLI